MRRRGGGGLHIGEIRLNLIYFIYYQGVASKGCVCECRALGPLLEQRHHQQEGLDAAFEMVSPEESSREDASDSAGGKLSNFAYGHNILAAGPT